MPTTNSDVLAQVAKRIDECVPSIVAASTVAVICSQGQSVVQISSGTLLAISDARFLVTAAHVAMAAKKMEGTPGIALIKANSLTSITGQWILSASDNCTAEGDKYDIALYRLDQREQNRLIGCEFVRLSGLEFTYDLSNGYFVLCGFPNHWSVSSDNPAATLILKPIQYGAWSCSGSTKGLEGYDATHHMLLEANPETNG